MASYGVFLAACGFECDGPSGHLGFAPRVTPENFRVAFTAPEGWGSFRQKNAGRSQTAELALQWGRLRLKSLSLQLAAKGSSAPCVRVKFPGRAMNTMARLEGQRLEVEFNPPVVLEAGQVLQVKAG
jgi:non-lysosomal glucosylceramidase